VLCSRRAERISSLFLLFRPDQITLQDTDELRLQEDQFATSEADYQMMADPEGDMSVSSHDAVQSADRILKSGNVELTLPRSSLAVPACSCSTCSRVLSAWTLPRIWRTKVS
jgi:hypothetical protein